MGEKLQTNKQLIKFLVDEGYLKSRRIIDAFEKIDRGDFVPDKYISEAYANYPLPIGHGQTISQPLTVAFMLELLDPRPEEKILEIGAGSGWQAALLAQITGPEGLVVAIERIPELVESAKENVHKYGFLSDGRLKIFRADGSRSAPPKVFPQGGFDKIVAAAAGDEIPKAWKDELKIGGKIIAPVLNSIVVLEKISEENFKKTEYPGFSFVPLIKG